MGDRDGIAGLAAAPSHLPRVALEDLFHFPKILHYRIEPFPNRPTGPQIREEKYVASGGRGYSENLVMN